MPYNYNNTGLMNQLYRQKENIEWYAKFSKDFITDPDAIDEKVYCYFMKIPRK